MAVIVIINSKKLDAMSESPLEQAPHVDAYLFPRMRGHSSFSPSELNNQFLE
jgi:hypothetical protein